MDKNNIKYIDLLNSFWSIQGDYPLDNHSRALYFYLAYVWNECRRPSVFKRRNDVIERDLKITRNTLNKARNILLESDFISFETYNGIANVDYTLSKYDEVSGKPIKSSSNFDEVEEKAHQILISYEQTLSNNDEVLAESLSKFDKVEPTLSQTLSEFDNHKQRETENNIIKENNKKKESSKPSQNLIRSLIPTKDDVINFFFSNTDLKPSEAELRAESFYSHFSEKGWRDGKSIIFDWIKAAQDWKGEISDSKGKEGADANKSSQEANELQESKINSEITRFKAPTVEEVDAYCKSRNNGIDAEYFVAHYTAVSWMRGKTKIKDWKACVRTWEKNNFNNKSKKSENGGITESLARSVAEGIARGNHQG